MPKNKISDLRDHLFETIEQLKDRDNPMELARAKAISEVAQTIINSAKIEVDALNALGGTLADSGASFLEVGNRGEGESPRLLKKAGG